MARRSRRSAYRAERKINPGVVLKDGAGLSASTFLSREPLAPTHYSASGRSSDRYTRAGPVNRLQWNPHTPSENPSSITMIAPCTGLLSAQER
jgi:hypothetical protein